MSESSSSSEAWSGSDDGRSGSEDVEQAAAHAASSRPRHGEKRAYKAPKGYHPTTFSSDLLSTFGVDHLRAGGSKELWCIKIPEGVSPAQLNGLSIEIPSKSMSSDKALAQIEIDRQGKGAGSTTFRQHYTLRSRKASQDRTSAIKSGYTQLIAMADGSKALDNEDEKSQSGNDEMHGLQLLLPHPGKAGRYVHSPAPIVHHMQLVLNAPNNIAEKKDEHKGGDKAFEGANRSAKPAHSQPRSKMHGSFKPAGCLVLSSPTSKQMTQDATDEDSSPRKKRKGEKLSASPKKGSKANK